MQIKLAYDYAAMRGKIENLSTDALDLLMVNLAIDIDSFGHFLSSESLDEIQELVDEIEQVFIQRGIIGEPIDFDSITTPPGRLQ